MTGLDVEAVLRDHRPLTIYSAPHECVCICDRGPRGQRYRDETHRAHVAAVLRVEIESALADAWELGRAAERHHATAVRDYAHWSNISAGPPADPPNPYRPTLAATEGDRQ